MYMIKIVAFEDDESATKESLIKQVDDQLDLNIDTIDVEECEG